MGNVTSFQVTGDWRHIIDDGMVDVDALPDEALPTGHVIFTPLSPKVAVAGAPAVAHTLGEVKSLIAGGELTDLQGREGVWLAGKIGDQTVRWRAVTHLFYKGQKIAYPVLEFDLVDDAVLTGLIQNSEPGQPPIVVDPRIEALVRDAQAALNQTRTMLAEATEYHEDVEQWHGEIMPAAAQVSTDAQAAHDASVSATSSAGAAAASASDAADSEQAAAASASSAAASASEASDSSTAASADRQTVQDIRDNLQALLDDSEAWAGFEEAIAQIEPRMAAEVDKLKGDAPEAFDTLGEVAAWIADHSDEAAAMLQSISERAKKTYVDEQLSGKADKGAENTAQWSQVSGKPSAFPSTIDAVAGLSDALAGAGSNDAAKLIGALTSNVDLSKALVTIYGQPSPFGETFDAFGHAIDQINLQLDSKSFRVVSALPASPDPNTIYLVRE